MVQNKEEIKAKFNTGDELDKIKFDTLVDDIDTLIPKDNFKVINGHGFPNVAAVPGTVYHDLDETMGARLWIKSKGVDNQNWKPLQADTGVREIPIRNGKNSKVFLQRVGNVVSLTFGGSQWGWFSLDLAKFKKEEWLMVEKGEDLWIKMGSAKATSFHNAFIPQGFRSQSGTTTGVYDDNSRLIGAMYYGGQSDSNALILRFPKMKKSGLTDKFLTELRVAGLTYLTDNEWPSTFDDK